MRRPGARPSRLLPLALLVAAVLALVASPGASAAELAPGPGRLSIEYRPLGDKPGEAWGKSVWNDGFMKRGVELLNERLTLPANVTIAIRPGESVDASPGPGEPLVLGYINPKELRPVFTAYGLLTRSGKKVIPPRNAKGRAMVDHAVVELEHALAFHEVGHVYTEQWPLATTSDNEAIADLFSAWVTVNLMHDPEALLALANYRLALGHLLKSLPGFEAWELGQGYADLARLAAARPSWEKGLAKLAPKGYISNQSNFSGFVGGPFAGLEAALRPIALTSPAG